MDGLTIGFASAGEDPVMVDWDRFADRGALMVAAMLRADEPPAPLDEPGAPAAVVAWLARLAAHHQRGGNGPAAVQAITRATAALFLWSLHVQGKPTALPMPDDAPFAPGPDGTRETQTTVTAWQTAIWGEPPDVGAVILRALCELVEAAVAAGCTPAAILTTVRDEMARQFGRATGGGCVAHELADTVIVLYRAAECIGVDLLAQVDRVMGLNRLRFVPKPAGSASGPVTEADLGFRYPMD